MLFPLLAGLVLFCGCPGKVSRSGSTLAVFVSGRLRPAELARAAAAVDERRSLEPCLWFVTGPVMEDEKLAMLTRGRGQAKMLDAAGVDAVMLDPGWFRFGLGQVRELVDDARFATLGYNLNYESGEPLGHPLLVKRAEGFSFGVTALWLDTGDVWIRPGHIEVIAPEFAARKVEPLLRMRAEVTGVLLRAESDAGPWGFDVLVGAERDDAVSVGVPDRPELMHRLDLVVKGGRISDYSVVEVPLRGQGPDPEVERVVDSVLAAVDTAAMREVTRATVEVPARVLANATVARYVKEGADGILHDSLLVRSPVQPGPVTVGTVIDMLRYPGRMMVVTLTGRDIKTLQDDHDLEVEFRKSLKMGRMKLNREYRLAVLPGFARRHPEVLANGFELDERPLWEHAVQALAGGTL